MSTTTIEVSGSHVVALPPERGLVEASISLEGRDPLAVFELVADALNEARRSIERLHDLAGGPVTWFAINQIGTGTRRPYHREIELPLVHTATARLKVKFKDFEVLSEWLAASAAIQGFTAHGIAWDVTKSVRDETVRDVRKQAVRNARTQAQDYADALELGQVKVTKINDDRYSRPERRMALTRTGDADGDGADLAPEDVEISASVSATFVVGEQG